MLKAQAIALAAGLFAACLSGCSPTPLPAVPFTAAGDARNAKDQKEALEAAQTACQDEARRKGIASVAAILTFRGRTSQKDYLECMQRKGYETTR